MAIVYALYVEPEVHAARQMLPGHVRHRFRKIIDALALDPRPATSRALDVGDIEVPNGIEIRRVRLDRWRLIYAVDDDERWVWVLGIRRRPPYNYEDLVQLAGRL